MARQEAKGTPKWTIMVYMAAQNLLANFAVESLKQLKSAAGGDVIVAAQLHADINEKIRRYTFGKGLDAASEPEIVKLGKADLLPDDFDMANPNTLTHFLDWAREEYQAQHYCLVLWSEGPHLEDACYMHPITLVDVDPKAEVKKVRIKRLMPEDLNKAIAASKFEKGEIDIVVMDACCVGMLEVARELQDSAKFMIASQEEVPDASIPYRPILEYIRDTKKESSAGYSAAQTEKICAAVTQSYIAAYADYISNDDTCMKKVTLSGLCLEKTNTVTVPLKKLSEALLLCSDNKDFYRAIIGAREKTRGFVAGLYVDLFDLCEQLEKDLAVAEAIKDKKLKKKLIEVCGEVRAAIQQREGFVIANNALEERCHGISVYYPYVTDQDEKELKRAGGLREKGGLDVPLKLSLDRVETVEKEYDSLQLSKDTNWNKFIKHGWSRILATEKPEELDRRYSAAQCALNLLSLCQELRNTGKADSQAA